MAVRSREAFMRQLVSMRAVYRRLALPRRRGRRRSRAVEPPRCSWTRAPGATRSTRPTTGVSAEGVAYALFEPDSGFADPVAATRCVRRGLGRRDAREGVRVDAVEPGRGVRVGGELVEADNVVLAAGPWTKQLCAAIGLDLPLEIAARAGRPLRGAPRSRSSAVSSQVDRDLPAAPGRRRPPARRAAAIPKDYELVDPDGFDDRGRRRVSRPTCSRACSGDFRGLDGLQPVGGRVGLYEVTPDWHPILGPVDGLRRPLPRDRRQRPLLQARPGDRRARRRRTCSASRVRDVTTFSLSRFVEGRELRSHATEATGRRSCAAARSTDGTGADGRVADVAAPRAAGSRGSGRFDGDARDRRRGGPRRRARLRRHPQPLRLHAARRPARGQRDPPGRHAPRSSATAASAASRSATRASRGSAIYGYSDDAAGRRGARPASTSSGWSAARPAVNVLSLVPNGQLRLATRRARRPARRRARSSRTMQALLRESLDAGRLGLLDRPRVRAGGGRDRGGGDRARARARPFYATHTRRRDDGAADAVAEAIRVGATRRGAAAGLAPRPAQRHRGEPPLRRARRGGARRRPGRRVRHAHAHLRPDEPLRGAAAVGARAPTTSPRSCATRRSATAMRPHR